MSNEKRKLYIILVFNFQVLYVELLGERSFFKENQSAEKESLIYVNVSLILHEHIPPIFYLSQVPSQRNLLCQLVFVSILSTFVQPGKGRNSLICSSQSLPSLTLLAL